jgi:protein involved in plasmid replication-relaxation
VSASKRAGQWPKVGEGGTGGVVVVGRRGWRELDRRLLAVLGRLTDRDRLLCRLLDDHRVLTSAQVADVAFTGERRARMRLSELYAMDVLDRFRTRAGGNPGPFHWVLGPLGAALVAAEAGVDVSDLDWRRDLVHDLAASQRLGHLTGLNGFFTGLLRSARTELDCDLLEWWSERRCAREWGEVVRPDGYGVWSEEGLTLPFLFEFDNGTERLGRLSDKLGGYAKLAAAAGHRNWVLFSFGSSRREHEARAALSHSGVLVATCSRIPGIAPNAAIWRPVGNGDAPLRLIDLAGAERRVTRPTNRSIGGA